MKSIPISTRSTTWGDNPLQIAIFMGLEKSNFNTPHERNFKGVFMTVFLKMTIHLHLKLTSPNSGKYYLDTLQLA